MTTWWWTNSQLPEVYSDHSSRERAICTRSCSPALSMRTSSSVSAQVVDSGLGESEWVEFSFIFCEEFFNQKRCSKKLLEDFLLWSMFQVVLCFFGTKSKGLWCCWIKLRFSKLPTPYHPLGCLGFIEDYTAQLYGRLQQANIRIPIKQPGFNGK